MRFRSAYCPTILSWRNQSNRLLHIRESAAKTRWKHKLKSIRSSISKRSYSNIDFVWPSAYTSSHMLHYTTHFNKCQSLYTKIAIFHTPFRSALLELFVLWRSPCRFSIWHINYTIKPITFQPKIKFHLTTFRGRQEQKWEGTLLHSFSFCVISKNRCRLKILYVFSYKLFQICFQRLHIIECIIIFVKRIFLCFFKFFRFV